MTPESKVKTKVKKILKELGAYYVMPATGGFGNSGAPDFVVCHRGRFFGIECKAGRNTTTALQDHNLYQIQKAGGTAMIINESNVDTVQTELEREYKA
jgi:Holliday junction resolvase